MPDDTQPEIPSDVEPEPPPPSDAETPETGDSDAPDRDSRVGAVLAERYRVERLIDTGAMGRVYEGHHIHMRKRVAIKILHRELSAVPDFVSRFEREAMAAANIGSEHVAAATDFGKLPDGSVYLVLEYVEGRILRRIIDEGPMEEERALPIARQIALALRSAHGLGVVHRDLKPENVMLVTRDGVEDLVKVLDFGVAKVPIGEVDAEPSSRRPITKAGIVFGTPEYMAPEQALGKKVDHRADLFSLGVILYEMLAGVRPWDTEGPDGASILGQQLSGVPPTIGTRAPDVVVHPGIERLVLSLLDREPKDRPQTAQDTIDEIDRLLGRPVGRGELITVQSEAPVGGAGANHLEVTKARVSIAARRAASPVVEWVEAHRSRLPGPVRGWPVAALVGAPVGVLGLLLGALALSGGEQPTEALPAPVAAAPASVSAATPAPPSQPKPSRAKAGEAELEVAAKSGEKGLLELRERFPEDPRVPVVTAGVRLAAKDYEGAIDALGEALEIDPGIANDTQVASVLWVAAQNKTSSNAAFTLLTRKMGAKGRKILGDLSTTQGVKPAVRDRARKALALMEE
jgi:serine/threonine-protein kinase